MDIQSQSITKSWKQFFPSAEALKNNESTIITSNKNQIDFTPIASVDFNHPIWELIQASAEDYYH